MKSILTLAKNINTQDQARAKGGPLNSPWQAVIGRGTNLQHSLALYIFKDQRMRKLGGNKGKGLTEWPESGG